MSAGTSDRSHAAHQHCPSDTAHPAESLLRYEGINHGDFSDLNVLVQSEGDGHKISGILDFGDMSSGYYIYELAITIMYMMTDHPKPIEVGGPVLTGWESVLPLNEAE